ncbi:hypothetical protein B0H13DRAFT_2369904 [Mycena leptocephala]|nr:hypothetical protein B0H13DRAFT_2369904 [Mycena leptocephala]
MWAAPGVLGDEYLSRSSPYGDMVHDHPVAVAVYVAKHDYPYLVPQVAPIMISMPPVDVIEMLPRYLILPWEWTRVLQTVALKLDCRGTNNHLYAGTVTGTPGGVMLGFPPNA